MTDSAGSLSGGEARATWGGPHLQERLAAGGQNTEGNGGASSEPESAGGARGGCGGTELAAGSSVNTGSPGSRARRQTREGLNGVKPGETEEFKFGTPDFLTRMSMHVTLLSFHWHLVV